MGIGTSVPHPSTLSDFDKQGVLGMNLTAAGIGSLIQSKKVKNVVVVCGAGLSVAAGIPDFRSPGTGLYDNLQKYDLENPTDVFDISFFRTNPRPFFALARELYPGKFTPTKAHYFLRLLEEKGVLRRVYTQNIDVLERIAGLSHDKLVEAHGSFASATCIGCGASYTQDWVKSQVFDDDIIIPRCTVTSCGSVVKPDITFFGENLPERYGRLCPGDLSAADLLIVMGTSLSVAPVSSMPARVGPLCPRVLINREAVFEEEHDDPDDSADDPPSSCSGAFRFSKGDNYRDVFLQGDCDSGVSELAREFGWLEELNALYAREVAELAKVAAEESRVEPASSSDAPGGGSAGGASGVVGAETGSGGVEAGTEEDGRGPVDHPRESSRGADGVARYDMREYIGGACTADAQARGADTVRESGLGVLDDAFASLGLGPDGQEPSSSPGETESDHDGTPK